MNSFKIILKGTLTKPLTPVFEGKRNKAVGESNVEKTNCNKFYFNLPA